MDNPSQNSWWDESICGQEYMSPGVGENSFSRCKFLAVFGSIGVMIVVCFMIVGLLCIIDSAPQVCTVILIISINYLCITNKHYHIEIYVHLLFPVMYD